MKAIKKIKLFSSTGELGEYLLGLSIGLFLLFAVGWLQGCTAVQAKALYKPAVSYGIAEVAKEFKSGEVQIDLSAFPGSFDSYNKLVRIHAYKEGDLITFLILPDWQKITDFAHQKGELLIDNLYKKSKRRARDRL